MKKILAIIISLGLCMSCAYAEVIVTFGQKSINSLGNFSGICTGANRTTDANGNKSISLTIYNKNSAEVVTFQFTNNDFQEGVALSNIVGKSISIGTTQLNNNLLVKSYFIGQ